MAVIKTSVRNRRHGLAVGPAGMLVSGGLILASMIVSNREPVDTILFRVGMAVLSIAATVWVVARAHATEQQLECIRQRAYDEGYSDGCEVSRVVQMRRPSAVVPVSVVAGDSAAEQLGDQCDVGQPA